MWEDPYDCRGSLFSSSDSIELSFREKKETKNGEQSLLGPFLYFMCTHIYSFIDQIRWNQVLSHFFHPLKDAKCKVQINKKKLDKINVCKVVFAMQLLYLTPCSPPAMWSFIKLTFGIYPWRIIFGATYHFLVLKIFSFFFLHSAFIILRHK